MKLKTRGKKIVIPSILYGSEVWNNISKAETDQINRTQRRIVKKIQGFPLRTRTDICESMLGLHPLYAEIIKQKLMFLHKIMSLSADTISSQIFFRRLYLYVTDEDLVSSGFIPDICKILCHYNLQFYFILNAFSNGARFPGKYEWRGIVRKAIYNKEHDLWQTRLNNDNELKRFRQMHTSVQPCLLWTLPKNRIQLRLARYISHLWTIIPGRDLDFCHLCGSISNDIVCHSVAECRVTFPLKEHFINWVSNEISVDLYNELTLCDAEQYLTKVLGATYETPIPEEQFNTLVNCAFLYIKECLDFAHNTQ